LECQKKSKITTMSANRPLLHSKSTVLVASLALLAAGAAEARETIPVDPAVGPGTFVVRTREKRLYFVVEPGAAIRYRVAVGKPARQWFGEAVIDGKHLNPGWIPPEDMKKARPELDSFIPGGAPKNPMGVAALTLSGDRYAIHGTNQPESIGREASFGCIRMLNEDILDLFERVDVGTKVIIAK